MLDQPPSAQARRWSNTLPTAHTKNRAALRLGHTLLSAEVFRKMVGLVDIFISMALSTAATWGCGAVKE